MYIGVSELALVTNMERVCSGFKPADWVWLEQDGWTCISMMGLSEETNIDKGNCNDLSL